MAHHPGAFLCGRFDEEPEAFLEAVQETVSHVKNPPRTLEQHLGYLRAQGLKKIAGRLANRLQKGDKVKKASSISEAQEEF